MPKEPSLLERIFTLVNLLTALGVVAMAQVFWPELLGRWGAGPFYSFIVGAVLLMAATFLRNRNKRDDDPDA